VGVGVVYDGRWKCECECKCECCIEQCVPLPQAEVALRAEVGLTALFNTLTPQAEVGLTALFNTLTPTPTPTARRRKWDSLLYTAVNIVLKRAVSTTCACGRWEWEWECKCECCMTR
jgi:hypothetical protein